jgi:hypothetical protein
VVRGVRTLRGVGAMVRVVGTMMVVLMELKAENLMEVKVENLMEIQKPLVEFPTKFIIKRCRTNPTAPPNNESPLNHTSMQQREQKQR